MGFIIGNKYIPRASAYKPLASDVDVRGSRTSHVRSVSLPALFEARRLEPGRAEMPQEGLTFVNQGF